MVLRFSFPSFSRDDLSQSVTSAVSPLPDSPTLVSDCGLVCELLTSISDFLQHLLPMPLGVVTVYRFEAGHSAPLPLSTFRFLYPSGWCHYFPTCLVFSDMTGDVCSFPLLSPVFSNKLSNPVVFTSHLLHSRI